MPNAGATAYRALATPETRARLRVLIESLLDCDIVVDDLRRERREEHDPVLLTAIQMRDGVARELAALVAEVEGA